MKGIHMKAPALSEIYTQKVYQQAHRKKLQQIREERKSQISMNHIRLSNIQHIKDTKNRSFAYKCNQQSQQINKQNLRLLARLQKTKPYFRYTSHQNRQMNPLSKSRQSSTFVTPYIKKQKKQAQKQNERLSHRMSSISSSLNQKNQMKDFVKSQRIKQRITRYAAQNNKILLKSEKFISNLSSSKLDTSSEHTVNRPKSKSTTANYYKKEDIMKYKIENVGKSLMKIKNRTNSAADQNNQQNKGGFFSTEPLKNISQRRIHNK